MVQPWQEWPPDAGPAGTPGPPGPPGPPGDLVYSAALFAANFTAAVGVISRLDFTGAPFTALLPAAPADNDICAFNVVNGGAPGAQVTIGGNGKTIFGAVPSIPFPRTCPLIALKFSSADNTWFVLSLDVTTYALGITPYAVLTSPDAATNTVNATQLPDLTLLGRDNAQVGNALAAVPFTRLLASFVIDTFDATAGQTVFALSTPPINIPNILVWVNGVLYTGGVDFTYDVGTQSVVWTNATFALELTDFLQINYQTN